MRRKPIYILIGLALALIATLLTNFYRPYIFQNNLYDFHFADTIGSLFCVPAQTFFIRGFSHKYSFYNILLPLFIGDIIYEFFTVFDYYDIIAIFIGVFITYMVGLWFKIDKKEE